jgi:polyhydroxyalkanoate synthesis repressor PhaR
LRVNLVLQALAPSVESAALQQVDLNRRSVLLKELQVPAKSTSPKPTTSAAARRVIKKYPNRRLYDTTTSTYITLSEIKSLVMDSLDFVVTDAKTGEDLTRPMLLQIILEEEAAGAPMFSEAVLGNIIRFYGHAMQGFMGKYLESNVQSFMDMQSQLGDSQKGVSPEIWTQFMKVQPPMMQNVLGTYVQQSQSMLGQMQEQVQKQTEQMLGALGIKK